MRGTDMTVAASVFAVLIVAQLVPVRRENPSVTMEVPAPPAVRRVLRGSCYDCHSNETRWPWYAYVAPVSWVTARDVAVARTRMNFSTWDHVAPPVQYAFMRGVVHHVGRDHMPPWYYRLAHRSATLTPEERTLLRDWAIAMSRTVLGQTQAGD